VKGWVGIWLQVLLNNYNHKEVVFLCFLPNKYLNLIDKVSMKFLHSNYVQIHITEI